MPASALKIPSIFTAVDKFSAPLKKMGRGMKNFARRSEVALSRVERRVRKLTPSFRGLKNAVGSFGLILGGAAIIGAMGSAISIFADFEQANASLSAVMSSATGPQLQALSNDAIRLGSITAKTATEVVALQETLARLGFETPQVLNMTESIISGSIAMQAELAETAELTGAVINTFAKFSSIDAPEIMDQLVLATQKSALNFEKLQTALPIVSKAADASGISFTAMTATLGVVADAGIDASSSATALRNIYLESAKRGVPYQILIEKISKSTNKLKTANELFGKRGAVVAVTLAENQKKLAKLDKALQSVAKGQKNAGVAQKAAEKQLDTLTGTITLLGSAYTGFILSLEKGNGTFGSFLKSLVRVGTAVLALLDGSKDSVEALDKLDSSIVNIAKRVIFWGKVLGTIVGLYIAANVALKIWRFGLVAYNIVVGISAARSATLAVSVGGGTAAQVAQLVVTKGLIAAQWLWNAAMTANPIGLIIVGIAALIALVAVIILKYNEWGAALSLFLGPLGAIINLIQSFRRNWDLIKQAFKEGGILAGFKAIGATILDAILMPLQQVFQLMTDLPGVGEFASKAVSGLQKVRESLGVNIETDESGNKLINPEAVAESAKISREERIEKQTGILTIDNKTENEATLEGGFSALQVQLGSTQGF